MSLVAIILIGIALSMDAFSLSIIYGTLQLNKLKIYLLSMIVGLYHFFMPLIGIIFGGKIEHYLFIDYQKLVFILFLLIGIQMFKSIKDQDLNVNINIWAMLLFGFSVSLDSFTVGIGLEYIDNNHLLSSFVFMILSAFFTFLGLKLGVFLRRHICQYSSIIGGIIFIFLAFYYLLN